MILLYHDMLPKAKRSDRLFEQERELPRAPDGSFGPGDLAGGVEAEIRDPLQPFLDRDRHFHPREVGADTTVDAEAERGVAVLLAVDHDLVGIGKHRGVAIGG